MYVCMYRSRARNIKETAACELIGAKKGRNAIPQTHSTFYPHRFDN